MLVRQRQSGQQPWQPCVLGMRRGLLGQRQSVLGMRRGMLIGNAMRMHFYCGFVTLSGNGNDGTLPYLILYVRKFFGVALGLAGAWPWPWAWAPGSLGFSTSYTKVCRLNFGRETLACS